MTRYANLIQSRHTTPTVTIYFAQSGDYIACMGELYDFTEFKLAQLMEVASESDREDLAEWLWYILNEYSEGNVLISFENGWPVVNYVEP